jgi:hypothetical protein
MDLLCFDVMWCGVGCSGPVRIMQCVDRRRLLRLRLLSAARC